MHDLHDLPKLRDSLSYLYVEHAILDRKDSSIEIIQKNGRTAVPAAGLCVLMLGPGTSISHAAVKVLAESGCSILWTGEDTTHMYAQGLGETRKAYHLLRQAELASNPEKRIKVALEMYRMRFKENIDASISLEQIRGYEGRRVRDAYTHYSQLFNIPWNGRSYDRGNWNAGDPVNRALSAANALLNGLCHAAIISGGYSTAIGFVHTGKQLSFVYDIADLYKVDITVPIAFEAAATHSSGIESEVRKMCREKFHKERLLERVLPDIDHLLGIEDQTNIDFIPDADPAMPEPLWDYPIQAESV